MHKQKLDSPTVTRTWHASKHKIYKLRQSYIVKNNKDNDDNKHNNHNNKKQKQGCPTVAYNNT